MKEVKGVLVLHLCCRYRHVLTCTTIQVVVQNMWPNQDNKNNEFILNFQTNLPYRRRVILSAIYRGIFSQIGRSGPSFQGSFQGSTVD